MAKVSWLHISDVHRGQGGESRWDHLRDSALEDIRAQARRHGPPDLVLFTGDLAYSGQAEEYRLVDRLLSDLRDAVGSDPIVLPVPGNHDLVRPGARRPITRCGLRRYLEDDEEIRRDLLEGKGEVRDVISSLFKNYAQWFEDSVEPQWRSRGIVYEKGPIAGDFRATIPIAGIRLGVIGVNSAFLHFEKATKTLAVEAPQQGQDAPSWVRRRDVNLLLMHHPTDWLDDGIRRHFLEMCYPAQRYAGCFFGHMHAARAERVVGSSNHVRRFFQGTSLFGLEHYGQSNEARVCGYSFGSLTRKDEGFRLAVKSRKYEGGVFGKDTEGSFSGIVRGNARAVGTHAVVIAGSASVTSLQLAVARELDNAAEIASIALQTGEDAVLSAHDPASLKIAIVGNTWPVSVEWERLTQAATTIWLLGPGHGDHDGGNELFRRLGSSALVENEDQARASALAQVLARTRAPKLTATLRTAGEATGGDPGLTTARETARALFDRGDFPAALIAFQTILEGLTVGAARDPVEIERARLNVAATLISLNRTTEAKAPLAAVDPTRLDAKLRAQFATLLAYCGETVRARDLLAGDASAEARRSLQVVELSEGKIPANVDPELRLEVARVMISRGSLSEAARFAMELLDEPAGGT